MNDAIAKYESPSSIAPLADTEDVFKLGDVLFKSGYFSDVKSAAQAIVKILRGRELGIGPVTAMEQIHVVQGKTGLGAALIGAQIKKSGRYDYQIAELSDTRCEIVFYERSKEIGRSSFDMDDAKRAKLVREGDNYNKFPRNMLVARALSNGARWYTPDVFGGAIYDVDELRAIEPADTQPVEASALPSTIERDQAMGNQERSQAANPRQSKRDRMEVAYDALYKRSLQCDLAMPKFNPEWTDEDLEGTGSHWKEQVEAAEYRKQQDAVPA